MNTLLLSTAEIERARRRAGDPAWAPAAEALRRRADRALRDESPAPPMDTAWYDADPNRAFAETYTLFHRFIRPATDRLHAAQTLARAALVFEEPRYLERARQWFREIVGRAAFHVRHHDSGMEYGRLAVRLAETLAALGEALPAAERDRALEQLDRAGRAILDGTRHWLENLPRMPYSNHLAFQRQGLLAAALSLRRAEWIADALDGVRGFGELLAGATTDDGLCHESSTHYHFATFHALAGIAELVRHAPALGRDLYRETFANGRRLKQMFDAPLGLLLPDGELPPVGDGYAERRPLWNAQADIYEIGFAVYGDPRYAWLLRRRAARDSEAALFFGAEALPAGEAPGGRTRIWIEHGYALLTPREDPGYWSADRFAPTAFLGFDRSGIHHHLDRLGLQIAGAGRLWLEDIESRAVAADGHAFSARIQPEFNRTGLPHNLVLVDQRSHAPGDRLLEIREFKDLPAVKSLSVADPGGALYEGVAQQRSVVVTEDYALDVFQLASPDAERIFDLLLHPRADGPADTGALAFAPDASLPAAPPFAVLRDVTSAPFSDAFELAWRQGDARCAAAVAVAEGRPDRVFRALWPTQSDWATGGRELFLVRARGPRACFVALYRLEAASPAVPPWRVRTVERVFNGKHDEIRVLVSNGDADRRHTLAGI